MKIVVLGATGQMGSVIYNGLKKTQEVVGTSRKKSEEYLKFDPFKDDWSVLGKPDILINCIGQIEATHESSFNRIHVVLTKNILTHRAQIGNPRIIQVSALGASSHHEVEFLRTKGIADELLLSESNTAIIRPSIVCTHHTMLVKKMIILSQLARLLLGIIPIPKGFLQTRIQPIMPADLVELVQIMCVDHTQQIVEAVGPEAISFRDIIKILMKSRKQQLRIVEIPKRVSNVVVRNLLCRIWPKIINAQQYQLLFENNTGHVHVCEQLLGRPLQSTIQFFEQEFISSR